jgi:hypothetical protein
VKAADVADSDSKTVGRLLKALTYSSQADEAKDQTELYDSIDTHFRRNFRKLNFKDATEILYELGESHDHKLTTLDDKFWIWETLEEAVRTHIDELSDSQVQRVARAFASNYKGSELLWDYIEQRVFKVAAVAY